MIDVRKKVQPFSNRLSMQVIIEIYSNYPYQDTKTLALPMQTPLFFSNYHFQSVHEQSFTVGDFEYERRTSNRIQPTQYSLSWKKLISKGRKISLDSFQKKPRIFNCDNR